MKIQNLKITNKKNFFRKNLAKWDPCWGWDNKIYYLGAFLQDGIPFWSNYVHLYSNNEIQFSVPKNLNLSAGTFTDNRYFGSLTYIFKKTEDPYIDQLIFVCDKNWNTIAKFRPSNSIKKPNNYFSKRKYRGHLLIPFRDPVNINQTNKFALCTGGFRSCVPGNVCEVIFKNNTFEITRETILNEDMMIFDEIERCTFWNEYMFFSAGEKANISINKIQVAKLNRNGFYSYFGEVQNSEGLYGPNLNSSLQMLYWYKKIININNPVTQNLFYENNNWIIKEGLKNKIIFILRDNQRRFSSKNLTRKIKKIIN